MTRIVDFIFLIFAAFLGKKALLLSVFAFAPSVLANDIPLATLSVDNIQVRAEWNMVGDSANHFSVEGGTLMLTADVEEGDTFIATVEVRDKFSTLNPNYEDLAVTVMITAVIRCGAEWTRNFAIGDENSVVLGSDPIKVGDVIARRYTANGYNYIYLHEVTQIISTLQVGTYISTSPVLYEHLDEFVSSTITVNGKPLMVNENANCFAEEVKTFQEQLPQIQKTEYLNANAPLVSAVSVAYGVIAVEGRAVTVGSAFPFDGNQVFYVNVSLGNILNELYSPKVIIDDGKAFRIDGKYPIGNSYAYFDALAVGSDIVENYDPHEVIVLNNCPTIYEVTTPGNTSASRAVACTQC